MLYICIIATQALTLVHRLYIHCVCFLVNLGALVLRALFEHWPSSHPPPQKEETTQTEKGTARLCNV